MYKRQATKCKVFIFDEPTRGIDIGAKEEIYKIISNLVNENKIVIVISSDMPELVSLSDMVGIMRDGRPVSYTHLSGWALFKM